MSGNDQVKMLFCHFGKLIVRRELYFMPMQSHPENGWHRPVHDGASLAQ
jgi:hypothetical protein